MSFEKDKRNVSRRDFLRTGGAVLAGAALPKFFDEIFVSRAEAVEVKEGMTWEEGLAALRQDVYNARTETAALYTEGEKTMWRKSMDLGVLGGSGREVASDERFFEHVLSKERVGVVRRAHTHAMASFVEAKYIKHETKDAVKRGDVSAPIAPPSYPDIMLHIWTKKRWFERRDVLFEDVVLDPGGMWRMKLKNGPFSDAAFAYHKILRNDIPFALERSSIPLEKKDSLLRCIKGFDVSCVHASGDSSIIQLFEECYEKRRELDGTFHDSILAYIFAAEALSSKSVHASRPKRQEWIEWAIECARRLDVELSFEPYKN
ncbi:MAG TPA: twin-arginine translocation signal domain-containing protein [Candidatus Paceibacterota bacterium]